MMPNNHEAHPNPIAAPNPMDVLAAYYDDPGLKLDATLRPGEQPDSELLGYLVTRQMLLDAAERDGSDPTVTEQYRVTEDAIARVKGRDAQDRVPKPRSRNK